MLEVYGIRCNSFEQKTGDNKSYTVVLNLTDKTALCNCKFFVKYGYDHNEPCKHILIVVASFKIAIEYSINIERFQLTKKKVECIFKHTTLIKKIKQTSTKQN